MARSCWVYTGCRSAESMGTAMKIPSQFQLIVDIFGASSVPVELQ